MDLDYTLGPPLTNIDTNSSTGVGPSTEFIHVLTSALRTMDKFPVDVKLNTLQMAAITGTLPQSSDWQTSDWLERIVSPGAGSYARLPYSNMVPGQYNVFLLTNGEVLRSPGKLIIV